MPNQIRCTETMPWSLNMPVSGFWDFKQEEKPFGERRGSVSGKCHQTGDIEELTGALKSLKLTSSNIVSDLAMKVTSTDPEKQYEGAKGFRIVLSAPGDIPIQNVIEAGVVPHLVSLLHSNVPDLQFEAGWALTNVASGNLNQTSAVVGSGAIEGFLMLLLSREEHIQEQGLWGIGNIAGDRVEFRDLVLSIDRSVALILSTFQPDMKASTLRTAIWCVSNLCRGKPRPALRNVAAFVPCLARVLESVQDECSICDALWALEGIAETEEGLSMLIDTSVHKSAVRLMQSQEPNVLRAALRLVGQIATGNMKHTESVITAGALPCLKEFLAHPKKCIRKDACWTLSNITAGPPSQIESVMNCGIVTSLLRTFELDEEIEVRKEAAWAIANASTTACQGQGESLILSGCLKPVCDMLQIEDPKMLDVVVDAVENFLKIGRVNSRSCPEMGENLNPVVALLKENEGWNKLLDLHLQRNGCGNYDLWQKCGKLLQQYFPKENLVSRMCL